MRRDLKNLKYVFGPRSVAVIGASEKPTKLGNVILKNFVDGKFAGRIYPVNPKHESLLGLKCYPSIEKVPGKVDLAIFAVPARIVPKIAAQCGRKGVRGAVVLSAGFGEVGNRKLEEELKKVVQKYNIAMIGPNCLGVMNPLKKVDSIFFPFYKFERPPPGDISFVTQSGGVGTCVADLASHYGIGISKFISYGNGASIDEADLIEYLSEDKETKQILLYIEGTKDGRKLMEAMKGANLRKPVIVLKAGRTEGASEAAKSHTGKLAGSYLAYQAAFRQSKVIEVEGLSELFHVVNAFSQPMPKGKRVAVLTNGGGLGVLTADSLEASGLGLAKLSAKTKRAVASTLPKGWAAGNPIDLIADATSEDYYKSVRALVDDDGVDSIIVIILFQAPALDSRVLNVLLGASDERKKPIFVVAVGGDYTEENRKVLDSHGIPTYDSPAYAASSLKRFTDYALSMKKTKKKG